jgi:hypothetical protein
MQPTTKMQCTDETILETLYSTFSNFGLLTAHKMRLFGKFNLSDRITPVSGDMWIDNYAPADVHFYSLV